MGSGAKFLVTRWLCLVSNLRHFLTCIISRTKGDVIESYNHTRLGLEVAAGTIDYYLWQSMKFLSKAFLTAV